MSLLKRNGFRTLLQEIIEKHIHTGFTCNAKTGTSGGKIKCTLIPGDDIGPELIASAQEVLRAAAVPIEFETVIFSEKYPQKSAPLEEVIDSIKRNGVCLKGVTSNSPADPSLAETETLNMKLRRGLDLFGNIVHVKTLDGVVTRHKGVDFVVVREQIEGFYSGVEHESVPGVVECLQIVTAVQSERIAKFAFDYAMKNNRKKVTCVHKANIMKLGDGLFLRSCQQVGKLYPKIKFEAMIVDNTTMQLVSNPQQFDVMVMPNLYGAIISNCGTGLVGGAGIVPGASYSPDCAIFEPGTRHTYEEATGKNIANPTAMLLCAVDLLEHVNLNSHAKKVRESIEKVLREGSIRTGDLGGRSTSSEFTKAIIKNLGA